jgi:hypothetical protein
MARKKRRAATAKGTRRQAAAGETPVKKTGTKAKRRTPDKRVDEPEVRGFGMLGSSVNQVIKGMGSGLSTVARKG